MNIVVTDGKGGYHFRPDSTLNRELKDFYLPDSITGLRLTPCLYAKMTRSAKSVSKKFANRCFSEFDFGLLLDADNMPYNMATTLDNSTFFGYNFLETDRLSDSSFILKIKVKEIYLAKNLTAGMLEEALVKVTALSSLRTGDLLAVSLPETFQVKVGDCIEFGDSSFKIL